MTARDTPNSIGFEIYPNPVENSFVLKTDLPINKIIITDLLGKQVKLIIDQLLDIFFFKEHSYISICYQS